MRFKICLFAGLLSAYIVADTAVQPSYAQWDGQTPVIMAQNDKQGFFGRLFNRSDKSSSGKAKPLFLNEPGRGTTSRGPAKPYTSYGRSGRTAEYSHEDSLSAQQTAALNSSITDRRAAMMAKLRRDQAEQNRRANQVAASRSREEAPARTRMIYDPERVWTYTPGVSRSPQQGTQQQPDGQTNTRTRIYNTR